jgi:hypothetical protein
MIKIRKGTFETNSSSIHALCITKNNTKNISEVLEDLKNFDKIWDEYKIIHLINNGNYDDLHSDVKKLLNDIGFDKELASKDSDYTYNLINLHLEEFNGCSGVGGDIDIELNIIDSLYERYKESVDNTITFDDFKLKFNWEQFNLDNLFDADINWNRNKTIKFLKNNFNVIECDGHDEVVSDFFIMKDGTDVYNLINDYENKNYFESEIAEKGVKKVKREFYKFYKYSNIEEIIASYKESSPLTFKYLKENNII